jgi:hypothetical protein
MGSVANMNKLEAAVKNHATRAAFRRVLNELRGPSVGSSWPALPYVVIFLNHTIIVLP